MQKESIKDFLRTQKSQNAQTRYPIGKREKVLSEMTVVSQNAKINFNQCRNWKEVYQFHKKNTPWLDDTQINEYIKLYKMEAQTAKHKGKLMEQKQWMLNDL